LGFRQPGDLNNLFKRYTKGFHIPRDFNRLLFFPCLYPLSYSFLHPFFFRGISEKDSTAKSKKEGEKRVLS
jgi:hypothetical protein